MSVSREMPRYVCHKQVWALKIKTIEAGPFADAPSFDAIVKLHFHEEGYAPLAVGSDWYYKHKPMPGGYFVVYKDGYRSFSPADAFEDGYTPEESAALESNTTQERVNETRKSEHDERAAFEQAVADHYPGTGMARTYDGYAHTATHHVLPATYASVQMLWEMWHARAALAAQASGQSSGNPGQLASGQGGSDADRP